jgi:hypothetical protein
MGLHQRRQAYLDRIYNVHYPRFGVTDQRASQSNIHRSGSSANVQHTTTNTATRTRTSAFDKLLEAQKWVDLRTVRFFEFMESIEKLILQESFRI